LAALADLSTPQSDKADIQRKLRDILRDSGHLLSPALRASIHGLLWCTDPANRAAETFARFRPEYDRMVNQFRAAHFALPFVGRRPYRADAAVPLLRKGKHLL
jgi:hypothetical protein